MRRGKISSGAESDATSIEYYGNARVNLRSRPGMVRNPGGQHNFFNPNDLLQMRYEMIRRGQVERRPVTQIAAEFGVSRQAYYKLLAEFKKRGLAGLLPRRFASPAHLRCTNKILNCIEVNQISNSSLNAIAEAIEKRFGVLINPKRIARALQRRRKTYQAAVNVSMRE